MIKGKYGTYEWRNYSYFDVLGWREITENKTNTKENKTMKNSRENRMEALKAAGETCYELGYVEAGEKGVELC